MPRLIRHRAIVEDRWTLLRDATSLAEVPCAPAIIPLALWLARPDVLPARGDIGVWLRPDDDPDLLAPDCPALPLIAVDFPQFTDGRGYSIARILRERHGFAGELRAFGDIGRDQLFYLRRVGFDAFRLADHRDPQAALASFGDFSLTYQGSVDDPQPLFRKRAAGGEQARG